ncbi:MAG: response regulator transcription factor [Chloroflexota bacterium]|nr:response regulator transcription factor [Chloroflexota bacterium]
MSTEILIVDDEKNVRESLQDILELEGYGVDAVASGEDALDKLNEEEYNLMLLDLKMPGINGVEVMHQAHLLHPQTKIIVLTGHGSVESVIEAIRAGAHDYILKPFETESILISINSCLTAKVKHQRKKMLMEQIESSLERLKDIEGITTPDLPSRRIITLPQGIMVDLERREIWRGNTRSHLTPTECALFSVFLENRGRAMTHVEIVHLTRGSEPTEWEAPEILRPMISRLRKKFIAFPGMKKWISNVRGMGYVFETED